MESYSPEDILGREDYSEVLEDPESYDFAPEETDLENIDYIDSEDYSSIAIDRTNENIFFEFEEYGGANYYRAVKFGENHTLIESIRDESSENCPPDKNIQDEDFPSVIYFLATDEESFLFDRFEGYTSFPNDDAQEVHRKSQEIIEDVDPFSDQLLEPADD